MRHNENMHSLNDRLDILTARGLKVSANPSACVIDCQVYVRVDGKLRSAIEIQSMAERRPDRNIYEFTKNGKQFQVVVYFEDSGEQTYEVYGDGKRLGDRKVSEEYYLDLAKRICEEMAGTSLRRLL